MCFRAVMRRPLRSKREMISPLRPRAKASGLTRMSVLSIGGGRLPAHFERGSADGSAPRRCRNRRLAVRAHAPAWIERATAALARILQLAHAMRADEERPLDVALAVRARERLELGQPRLGRRDLELALADVLEVFGRPYDQVDERAHEREQRRDRRRADQHRVVDSPASIRVGPPHERQPGDDEEENQQVDDEVEGVVGDAKYRDYRHVDRQCRSRTYRKILPSRYPIPKNTKITVATTTATSVIIARKLGPSSCIRSSRRGPSPAREPGRR